MRMARTDTGAGRSVSGRRTIFRSKTQVPASRRGGSAGASGSRPPPARRHPLPALRGCRVGRLGARYRMLKIGHRATTGWCARTAPRLGCHRGPSSEAVSDCSRVLGHRSESHRVGDSGASSTRARDSDRAFPACSRTVPSLTAEKGRRTEGGSNRHHLCVAGRAVRVQGRWGRRVGSRLLVR